MCDKMTPEQRFIRRKHAAMNYMGMLLDVKRLSGLDAIQATSDKFCLNASVRDDYRIFRKLWALLD